jgi:hypothetical protein
MDCFAKVDAVKGDFNYSASAYVRIPTELGCTKPTFEEKMGGGVFLGKKSVSTALKIK